MLYYVASNNLCFCTTWQNRETRKLHFHSNAVSVQQSLLDFFNLFDSRLILALLYDSLNLVINAFSSGILGPGGIVQDKGSRQRCNNWTVLHAQCLSALSSWIPLSQGNDEALNRWDGNQSIFWLLTFSATLLPKIIIIGPSTSRF